jgi:hypothetical protein
VSSRKIQLILISDAELSRLLPGSGNRRSESAEGHSLDGLACVSGTDEPESTDHHCLARANRRYRLLGLDRALLAAHLDSALRCSA